LAIFAAIEGAQLVARGRKDIQACDQIIEAYSATGLFSGRRVSQTSIRAHSA
jgi:TetR/AcrR family transcriptional repressor of nem operon